MAKRNVTDHADVLRIVNPVDAYINASRTWLANFIIYDRLVSLVDTFPSGAP